jgi:hypothetical protein
MIDNFALALSHGLLLLAAWRLLWRPDLDDDSVPPPPPPAERPLGFRKAAPGA